MRAGVLWTEATMRSGSAGRAQRGFTYLMLIFAIAVAGVLLATAGQAYSEKQRRARETQLLRIGEVYLRAIESYYSSSPGSEKVYPRKLDDLLQDERFVTTRRHIRQLYPDPITNTSEWGLVQSPQGGIAGVYSRSDAEPLVARELMIAGQAVRPGARYSDTKFVFVPKPTVPSKGG